jgi:hypothetical protein
MKDPMIGVDLAKMVFQIHATSQTGEVAVPQEGPSPAVSTVHGEPVVGVLSQILPIRRLLCDGGTGLAG